jgi:hypothetical protein
MPQPRAYATEEVITAGRKLAERGEVTAQSLHAALGGRGNRQTIWRTWLDHVEDAGGLPVRDGEPRGLPEALGTEFASIVRQLAGLVQASHDEGRGIAERAAGQNLLERDALIRERDALARQIDDLTDQADDFRETLDDREAVIAALRLEIAALRTRAVAGGRPLFDDRGMLLRPIADNRLPRRA